MQDSATLCHAFALWCQHLCTYTLSIWGAGSIFSGGKIRGLAESLVSFQTLLWFCLPCSTTETFPETLALEKAHVRFYTSDCCPLWQTGECAGGYGWSSPSLAPEACARPPLRPGACLWQDGSGMPLALPVPLWRPHLSYGVTFFLLPSVGVWG